ncbi:ABC transporter ATP-binding protein [Xanthovirga aplysinae]|uniref:ABC transporter ATP-binding protein n=1 Tax=Xanthovirga aplysinae TaxID=2529853 RepID=UPI0012BC30ED|nr:ATP-binding cassette domain-containing protein [Xanthovirga aplysinae]MTI32354.1 ABC transporter ATP-binding protein [Xanthovirga aplysinae]
MDILKVNRLSKSYAAHQALKEVSLSVPKQSVFGLLGPNGAGKTTLIRIITQIIEADSGEVFIDGELLNSVHVGRIGYLPEERGLYKKMKVAEQLMYLSRLKGLSASESKERIKFWLKRLNIYEWWNKNVEDLSKGMQQKIQFIATVLHEPKLIILDEPFSGFDPINANLIKEEILRLRDKGSTIIFSTHRMESVEELCDHIALINKSQKILDGSKKEIKESFRNQTFVVKHQGKLEQLSDDFSILGSSPLEEDHFTSTLKINNGSTPNSLLQELIGRVEVTAFNEKVPDINEIFIQTVESETHV